MRRLLSLLFLLSAATVESRGAPSEPAQDEPPPSGPMSFADGDQSFSLRSEKGDVRIDQETGVLYGRDGVVFRHGDRTIRADQMIYDPRTGEAQAFGNVVFEGPAARIEAETIWYNRETEEGIGHNVRGWDGDLFFRGAEFRRISDEEFLFRRAPSNWNQPGDPPILVTPRYTTCDFPEPHLAIRAREFNLFPNDRAFARNAVVEVMGTPVFYLPFYTKGLGAGQPWDVRFGYSSLLGAMVSVDYNYRHRLYEPDPFTGELRRRASGHLRAGVDYFSRRGFGYGAEYGYEFEWGAHRGHWQTYFIEDKDRNDDDRWVVSGASRWAITEDLVGVIGADLVNDPEVYEDFFDSFDIESDRGRVARRRAYGALTLTQDEFVSRFSYDYRERLAEDRITHFSEPSDNNDDFEFDADGDGDDDIDERFQDSRYAAQSERLEYTFTTNELQIGEMPLFYDWDLTVFSNLDAGLNRGSDDDDARVSGLDFYQSLLWSIRLTDRLSLVVRGGLGLGVADRNSDDFDVSGPYPVRVNNVIFTDDDEFFTGTDLIGDDGLNDFALDGTEGAFSSDLMDYDDVDTFWVYGDVSTRLQARLSDALTAYAEWRLRESTGQNIGEFYAEAGQATFLEDLYAFRLEEHWAEAGVRYRLRRPSLTAGIRYERNLQGKSEIYNGETIQRLRGDVAWQNPARTLAISVGGQLQEDQLRHPSDSREVELTSVSGFARASYNPRHGIWHDTVSLSIFAPLEDDPFDTFDNKSDDDDLDENDHTLSVTNVFGVKISPLWSLLWKLRLTEDGSSESNANGATSLSLQRDLHDAVLIIGVAAENESFRGESNTDEQRIDATVAIRFKSSSEEPIGVARPTLVVPRRRPSEIDGGQ